MQRGKLKPLGAMRLVIAKHPVQNLRLFFLVLIGWTPKNKEASRSVSDISTLCIHT